MHVSEYSSQQNYVSLCIYKREPDGKEYFQVLSDFSDMTKLSPIDTRGDKLGAKTTRIYATRYAEISLEEFAFYKVDWTISPSEKHVHGFHTLNKVEQVFPYILYGKNFFESSIKNGLVENCLAYCQNLDYNKHLLDYKANFIFHCGQKLGTTQQAIAVYYDDLIHYGDGSVEYNPEQLTVDYIAFNDPGFHCSALGLDLYSTLDRPHVIEKKLTKSVEEVFKSQLIEQCTWSKFKTATGKSKRDFEEFQRNLNLYADEFFFDTLAARTGISIQNLKEKFELYIDKNNNIFNGQDDLTKIFENIVLRSSELQEQIKNNLKNEIIERNKEEFESLIIKKEDLLAEINDLQNQVSELKKSNQSLAEDAELYETVITESERKVDDLKTNLASYLGSVPIFEKLLNVGSAQNSHRELTTQIIVGRQLTCDEQIDRIPDFFDALSENLEAIGIKNSMRAVLATVLTGYLYNLPPTLLIGPKAKEIADAFSATYFSCTSATLDLSGCNYQEAISTIIDAKEKVILLENAFLKPYIWQLLQAIKNTDKKIFVTSMFVEELGMLPKRIFNYVCPICTELFYDSYKEKDQLLGAKFISGDLPELKSERTTQIALTSTLGFSEYTRGILGLQRSIASNLGLSESDKADLLASTTLVAYHFLNNGDPSFEEMLMNCQVRPSNELRSEIFPFCEI